MAREMPTSNRQAPNANTQQQRNMRQAPGQQRQQRTQQRGQNGNRQAPRRQQGAQGNRQQQRNYTLVPVDLLKMPVEMYWRGQLTRDLVTIRIVTPQERRKNGYGKPDVEVKSPVNGTYFCYRRDLDACFLDTNGNQIKARHLHTNRVYQAQVAMPPKPVVYIPPSKVKKGKRTVYTINGEQMPLGAYLMFYLDNAGNIIIKSPMKLKGVHFKRMVQPVDTFDSVKSRVARWKKVSSLGATEKFLNGEFRVVAKIEDINTFRNIGFVLSFIKNGKMVEADFTTRQVEDLVKQSRVRNMTSNYRLTYGNLQDLPTKFVSNQKVSQRNVKR